MRKIMRALTRLAGLAAVLFLAVYSAPLPAQQPAQETAKPPPVEWQEWSDELFLRARKEQKGILMTIVNPGCRPCDIADREVYTDPAVRHLISRLWIPVRVDAPERPDIDARYRIALATLSRRGSAGYPVTAFLFPTGEAIWVDTFIPARDREARPGLRAMLKSTDRLWKQRFEEARRNAMAIQAAFDNEDKAKRRGVIEGTVLSTIVDGLIARSDERHGGYGVPPRRQNAFAARLVLLASERREDPGLRRQALRALRGPVLGSVYDRLEGGFHKAPRSADWSVPWFGKDLMVNSAYLDALADAITLSGDEQLTEAASRTVDYILGRLRSEEGGFHSVQLSAVKGEDEAAYYSWDSVRVMEELNEETRPWAELLFGFREGGEPLLGLPARFTLKDRAGAREAVEAAGLDPAEFPERREEITSILSRMRDGKTPPEILPTRFLDSTSMACSSLLAAARALDREDAALAALEVLDGLLALGPLEDGVPHSLHHPDGSPVLMVDQAHLGNALVDAYEQTGDPRYLKSAGKTVQVLLDLFDSPDGAFYDVVEQKKAAGYVRIRRKVFMDTSKPSPLVEAARLLYRYGSLKGESTLVDRAEKALAWGISRLQSLDASGATLAMAVDSVIHGPVIIRIGGRDGGGAMRKAALELYEPSKVIVTDPDALAGAEICMEDLCRKEIVSPGELARELRALRSGQGQADGTPSAR